ncbi:MAG: THUMP domain-containing protein, partial [Candidatus Aenigmatarchaeota archaeon]
MEWILIRYGEIGLKSDWVRREFENRLMKNIREGFKSRDVDGSVERGYGRIFVKTQDIEGASDVLRKTFGIVSFSPCEKLKTDMDGITRRMADISENFIQRDDTFSVRARRTGNHHFSSKDIEESAGSEIIERTDAKVDLDDPDKTIYCEIRQNDTYIFKDKIEGPGGLPLGTQGN